MRKFSFGSVALIMLLTFVVIGCSKTSSLVNEGVKLSKQSVQIYKEAQAVGADTAKATALITKSGDLMKQFGEYSAKVQKLSEEDQKTLQTKLQEKLSKEFSKEDMELFESMGGLGL